jgi:hypothetical protein
MSQSTNTEIFPWVKSTGRTLVTIELPRRGNIRLYAEMEETLFQDLRATAQAMGEDEAEHIERALIANRYHPGNSARRVIVPIRQDEPQEAPRRPTGPHQVPSDTLRPV